MLACSERHSNISFLAQHFQIPLEILPPAFRRSSNEIQNDKTIKKKQTGRQAALNPNFESKIEIGGQSDERCLMVFNT